MQRHASRAGGTKKTAWTLVIGRKKPDTVKYTIIQ